MRSPIPKQVLKSKGSCCKSRAERPGFARLRAGDLTHAITHPRLNTTPPEHDPATTRQREKHRYESAPSP
eukprot:8779823-Alexandrium_andersonii.AAC.1